MTRPKVRSALPLPRYTRPRRLASGRIGYFFLVPKWARLKGCPIQSEPLGDNYDAAVQRAERVLLPMFDSWLSGGDDAKPRAGVVIGSVDWLFNEFRATWNKATAKRTRPLSPGQCRVHETGIKMISKYLLKDGRRVGSLHVRKIDTAFADALFEALLYRKEKDAEGNEVLVERRTTTNHSMKTARTAWNTVSRTNPGVFPVKNPFEKMGLASGDNTRETPHATFEQLMIFRAKAKKKLICSDRARGSPAVPQARVRREAVSVPQRSRDRPVV